MDSKVNLNSGMLLEASPMLFRDQRRGGKDRNTAAKLNRQGSDTKPP